MTSHLGSWLVSQLRLLKRIYTSLYNYAGSTAQSPGDDPAKMSEY